VTEQFDVRAEGLREIGQALKEVDRGLLDSLRINLKVAGDVVRDETRQLLTGGAARTESLQKTAEGIETRVRLGGQSTALLVVAQSLRKTTGQHPEFGSLQVRTMLEAEHEKEHDVEGILVEGVGHLLERHGF
jgi:hypothetical protein